MSLKDKFGPEKVRKAWSVEYFEHVSGGGIRTEYWEICYEEDMVFKADTEEDANNLTSLLNSVEADRDLCPGRCIS